MSRSLGDDAEYPYLPRNPANLVHEDQLVSSFVARRRFISLWFLRFVLGCTAIAAVVFLVVGFVAYSVSAQKSRIEELEQLGFSVVYLHRSPGQVDPLPEIIREWVGDHLWSEVVDVSQNGFFFSNSDFLSAQDVEAICRTCSQFQSLRSFSINSNHFFCDQIDDWPHLAHLERLEIGSARLADSDLAIVGRIARLKTLTIESATISSEGMAHLSALPLLEQLTLNRVSFTGEGQESGKGFGALKSLVLSQSPSFNDSAINLFGSPPQLEDVNFNRTPIGDRGLAALLRSGKVRSLIISEGRLTDESLVAVADYEAPGWMVMSQMPLTDGGLQALAGKEFSTLILDHTAMTDGAFRALSEIKGLEYVSLADTKLTGAGANNWNNEQRLKHLDLSGVRLTPAGIKALAALNCLELQLSRTSLRDSDLMLFAGNDDLAELDVTETAITPDGVRAFYEAQKRRLNADGRKESLQLFTDCPEVVSSILGFDPMTGYPYVDDETGGLAY